MFIYEHKDYPAVVDNNIISLLTTAEQNYIENTDTFVFMRLNAEKMECNIVVSNWDYEEEFRSFKAFKEFISKAVDGLIEDYNSGHISLDELNSFIG